MVRVQRAQLIRLSRLLDMMYRPSELADEISCHVDTIYRSYIPAGCPHTRDETGHIWINGVAFAQWLQSLKSNGRVSLADDEAYCLKCNQATKMTGSITVKPTNRYLELVTGTCSMCGSTVNRARAKRGGH